MPNPIRNGNTQSRLALFSFALLAAVIPSGDVVAHGDGFPYLYVAEDGADEGRCTDPVKPCKTIGFALERAEKGDEIRVSTGEYSFETDHPADALKLLGQIKRVRGGFDVKTRFQRRIMNSRATVLHGPHEKYRTRLAQNGILLAPEETEIGDPLRLAQAIAPAPNTRYVAVSGNDTGDCLSSFAPCRTIDYALRQAQSGEEIRVGEGGFELPNDTLLDADERGIRIIGGMLQATGFTTKALSGSALQTVVTGPSFKQRGRLAEMGFRLQQDAAKSMNIDLVESAQPAQLVGAAECLNGMADGHPCKGLDRVSQMPRGAFSSLPGRVNDIWGFVDKNDSREYILIGLWNGTAVVDVTDPSVPKEIGTIAGQGTIWRDIKVYQYEDEAEGRWKTYAYVTADDNSSVSHGIQVIDLTNLPSSISLAATLDVVDSAHNVYISNVDYKTGAALFADTQPFVYILGSNFPREQMRRKGEFFVLDVTDPVTPNIVQIPPVGSSYSHDATTLLISDDRSDVCKAKPCEVLIDYSEDAVDIWDVSVKGNTHKLGSVTYDSAAYIHSGWWSKDKRYIYVQDELDEVDMLPDGTVGNKLNTTVRVLDISELTNPKLVSTWVGPTRAIDHNGFTLGDEYYMSNYRRGLVVLDISDPSRPDAAEKLMFDTYIEDPRDSAEFNGAWGTYPYLESGTIAVSDIEGGLFLLKKR